MDNLFPFIFVIIAIVSSISSAVKKERAQKAAEERRRAASPVKPKTPPQKPSHPYAAAQQTVMPPMAFGDVPGQVITPTVHTHVQPDCATHAAPSGSLSYISSEGKDPCHADQLTHRRSEPEHAQEQPGLTLDWSGENLVKAFVMQEVLTRPGNRTRRCAR